MEFDLKREDLRNALPSLNGAIPLDGLEAEVQIYRDQYGVPHMRAQSIRDAFFVQGFVHAQDRLWQMEFDRRRAYGKWAEFAGSAALPMDLFARRARLGASAKADYAAFNNETKTMLEAYESQRDPQRHDGKLPATYEVVHGHAWAALEVIKGPNRDRAGLVEISLDEFSKQTKKRQT